MPPSQCGKITLRMIARSGWGGRGEWVYVYRKGLYGKGIRFAMKIIVCVHDVVCRQAH